MKLLFDQNLSPRLVSLLSDLFPDSNHVHLLGLDRKSDPAIWDYAQENEYIITTKDTDYLDYSAAFGFPPHVVSIRAGNCRTSHVEGLLRDNFDVIRDMVNEGETGLISLL